MKISNISNKIIIALFATLIFGLFIPQRVFGQTEKLGIVQYTPPKAMTKTLKENVVAFSEIDQTSGKFCLITLYGATPGTGNPTSDFTREWKNLVVETFKTIENPQTETTTSDGWTIIAGGAETDSEVGKAAAFLTVISGSGKTISILAVFNDPIYINQIDSFVSAIDLDKVVTSENNTNTLQKLTLDRYGNVFIPPPTRQITVADLAGEWSEESGLISTTYVNRSDGSYAGTDHLAYRSKMSITKDGGYKHDFFAVRNGKKEIDNTTGTIAIVDSTLFIKQKGLAKYVVRGWLELPNMTILKVCGPWFDDQEIPAEIFTNPEQGANLDKNWVRKK